MKFESKFGIGEIVLTHQQKGSDRSYSDFCMKVVAIQFSVEQTVDYICRIAGSGVVGCFRESELIGDPDFDQETGGYPKNTMELEND